MTPALTAIPGSGTRSHLSPNLAWHQALRDLEKAQGAVHVAHRCVIAAQPGELLQAVEAWREAEEQAAVVKAAEPSMRLQVLREVQEAWQRAPTNGSFTAWLASQIEAAGGQRRAG